MENFTTDNIVNKLSSLRMQMMLAGDIEQPGRPDATGELRKTMEALRAAMVASMADLSRDLKNLHKLNQVNSDGLVQQVGRVIEAINEATRFQQPALPSAGGNADQALALIQEHLQAMAASLGENSRAMQGLANLEGLLTQNTAVLGDITQSFAELIRVNMALGELFAGIYNKEFEI